MAYRQGERGVEQGQDRAGLFLRGTFIPCQQVQGRRVDRQVGGRAQRVGLAIGFGRCGEQLRLVRTPRQPCPRLEQAAQHGLNGRIASARGMAIADEQFPGAFDGTGANHCSNSGQGGEHDRFRSSVAPAQGGFLPIGSIRIGIGRPEL